MMRRTTPPAASDPDDPSASPLASHAAHPPRRRRGRRTVAIVLGVVAVLVLAAGGTAVALLLRVSDGLATNAVSRPGETPKAQKIPNWDGPVNLLIMGSDGRGGLASGDYGDDVDGDRSDTLMLLHVNAAHTDATLVSIPRDTMLPRPECTAADGTVHDATDNAQINSAFDVGPYCTLDTVRAYTGLDIDHFIVVNFDGFIDITDAIGGVDVCLAEDVDDPDSQLHLAAGSHTIHGQEALAFVRTRYGIGDRSDLGRIHTQQTYLSALARKVKSAETLTNPVALFGLADAAGRTLTVDKALSTPSALVGLAGTLAGVSLDRMVLLQLPVRDYAPDPDRVEPEPDQAEVLFSALREDRPVALTPPDDSAGGAGTADPSPGTSGGTATDAPAGVPAVTLAPETKGQTADRPTCAGG
ncbi:LCP family protein required for cell wall assembly [Microbacterium resistens]|uniref:LCP family protein required for cell wall assembly n=1 Tax=Microbacterium resistens TaxID=156977 RepID=A0ABU1SFC0_9MICO|nr:LCP family protein [Microbacterium resistens]MDR6868289.1 LCP family protein required for cell wall assembly [Microbacterium resistens]